MKKLLLLFAATALMLSCGDDDNGGSALKPSTITLQNGDGEPVVRTFTYDNKNRIQTMSGGTSTHTFAYNNKGKVASISVPGEDPVLFTYAANGDLQSFSSGDTVYPVTQLGDNSFSIGTDTYTYMSNGDWSKFAAYNFTYASGKGPFANVRGMNGLAIAIVDTESFLYAARKQLNTITIEGTTHPLTATPGDNGLPAQYQIAEISMQFQYSN